MDNRRLKTYVDDEGIISQVGNKGFLPELLHKVGWSGIVTRSTSKKAKNRNLWSFDIELPPDDMVELPHCEGVKFNVGLIPNIADVGRKARLSMRLIQFTRLDSSKRPRVVATVQGDISLVLPQIGLIPVGRVAISDGPTLHQLDRPLKLSSDLTTLHGSKSHFDVPIDRSILVIDDVHGTIHLSPSLDLRGRIYRLGNAGLLMSFDHLSFYCDGTKPRLNFTGGRIWRQGGAS